MKKITVILVIILCFSLFVACNNSTEQPTESPNAPIYWGKLSGVITENDKPLEGVVVSSGNRSTTTDKNGEYLIEVYNDGATISFQKAGCITQKRTFKSSDFYRDEINCDIIMFISAKVYGNVVDGNGNKVEGAKVSIGDQSTLTDENGHYEFASVIATSMVIIVEKDGKIARGAVFANDLASGEFEVADIVIK